MNIFSVLDTSDNEEEVVKNVPKKKGKEEQSNTKTDEKKQPAKPAAKVAAPAQNKAKETKEEAPRAASAGDAESKDRKDDNRGGRPRGKEGTKRGDKHHAGGEEAIRRPKREFDRRSGTGRGKELSKGGRGPYGFGNVDQEALEAEKDPATVDVNGDVEKEAENETVPAAEVEPATVSYEDFIKKRNEARAASAILSVSASGDAAKGSEEDSAKVAKKDQRSSNKTQVLDVSFRFESVNNDSREQRTGGRRENDRGGRGRGGRGTNSKGRGQERRSPAVTIGPEEFPSL